MRREAAKMPSLFRLLALIALPFLPDISEAAEQYWNGTHFSPNGQVNGGQGVWTNSGTNWTNSTGSISEPWGGDTAIFSGDYSLVDVQDEVAFNKLSFRASGMGVVLEGNGKLKASPSAVIEMLGTAMTTIYTDIDAQAGLKVQGNNLMWIGTTNAPGEVTLNANLDYHGTMNTPTLRVQGGSLRGDGIINGAVVFDRGAGSLLAYQGNLMLANSLELNNTAVTGFFGEANGLPTWDISGDLTLSGTLNFTADTKFKPGVYSLFNYGGSLTNNGFTLIPLASGGSTIFLDYTTQGEVNIVAAGGVAPQFWNGTHATPDGTVHGGNGEWTAGNTNWTNGSGTVSGVWAGTNAVFAGTAGTVSVESAVEFSMLQFLKDGYELTNGGGSLSGTGEIVVSKGSGATISAPIVGGGSIKKTGEGALTLSAANSFSGGLTVREGTLVAATNGALGSGTVLVDGAGIDSVWPVNSTLRVNSGVTVNNAITLNNRGILYNSGSIVRTGTDQIAVNSSAGEASVVNSGVIRGFKHGVDILSGTVYNTGAGADIGAADSSFAGNNSSAVNFRGQGTLNNTDGARISGSFPGYGVSFQVGGTVNNDGASINSNNDAIRAKGLTEVFNQNSASISSSVSGVRLENGGAIFNRNNSTIAGAWYGVRADDYATISNTNGSGIWGSNIGIWLAQGGSIENGTGSTITKMILSPTLRTAILVEGGVGTLSNAGTISGDVTMSGGYANEATLFIGSEITGALDMGTNTGSKVKLLGDGGEQLFSKAVAGALQLKGSLIKQGAGTWTLDKAEMEVGGVEVSGGALTVQNTLEAGEIDIASGELRVQGMLGATGQTRIGGLHSNEDGKVSVSGAGSTFGSSHIAVGGNGGKGTLEITNGGSVVTNGHASIGDATSQSSNVIISGTLSNWNIQGDLSMTAGNLSIKENAILAANSLKFFAAEGAQRNVSIDGAGSALLTVMPIDVSGSKLTVSNGGVVLPGSEPNTPATRLTVSGDGVVNIGGSEGAVAVAPGNVFAEEVALGPKSTSAFGGTVNFNHTASDYHFSPSFVGNGTVNFLSGTTILDANSAFNALINVKGGKLLVNGSLSGTTLPGITTKVESGASLGGGGALGGSVVVQNGGTLLVGNGASAGHFEVDSLSLNPSSNLSYFLGEANVVGGASNSLLTVNSALVLDGILNVADSGGFGPGSYRLINYGGSLTDNGLSLGSLPGLGASYTIQTTIEGQVNLIVDTSKPVQFWNGTTVSPDGKIHGGSGTWNSTTTNWTNSDGNFSSEWKSGLAVFTGTGGNVSVQSNLDFEGMQFAANGYTLSDGGGKLNATGAATIRVDSDIAATIAAEISGTGSITKTGAGTLTLTKQNTFAGGTRVEAGTLVAAISGALSNGPVLVNAAGGTNSTLQVNSGVVLGNAITLNNGAVLNNSGIIQRTETGQVAVTSTEGDATINNTNGSIRGYKHGVDILSGTVNNSGAAASINARDPAGAGNDSSAVNFRGVGTLRNTGRASISGSFPGYGVSFQAGGTVINDNASIGSNNDAIHAKGNMQILNENFGIILSGVSGIRLENGGTITNRVDSLIQGTIYGVEADESAKIVNSYDSEIAGGKSAIWLKKGGSIANIEGATIGKTTAPLFPNDPTIRIEGGAGVLENEGLIRGDVSMSSDYANEVVLHVGSELDGDLAIGTHADSTLNLWGENGEQLLSEAVTGDILFKGSLIKSEGGTWILDKPGMDIDETVVTEGTLVVQETLKTSNVEFTNGKLEVRGDLITGSILGNSGEMEVNGRVTATETKIASAILSGSGRIESNVLIDATGRLRPGAAGLDGILDIDGDLAISDEAFLDFSLGSPGNAENSQVNVDGDLKLGGKLSILDLPGFGTGAYTLFDYTGALTQGRLAVVDLPAGFNPGRFSIDLSDEGEVKLVVAATGSTVQYWLGGSGEWRAGDPNWTNGNGSIDAAWFGETAAFRGQAGTVTVRGSVSFQELIFETSGYSIVSPDGELVPTGDATIDVKSGAIVTISAPIVGSGGLTKVNGGTLVLGGAVPSSTSSLTVKGGVLDLEGVFSTGGTDVFAGSRLIVNGVLKSAAVNNWGWLVMNGLIESPTLSNWGRLSGAGVIEGDVVNSSVLAPGNSPGVLTILGNYTQTSSGIFELEVASSTVFDQLIVSGTANLAGTLDVVSLGSNRLEYGQQIPFLQASKIEGTFDRIVMPNPATLRGRFWDNDGTGVLLVAPTSYTLVAETPNQTRVAKALDQWIGIEDGDIGAATLALDMLPGELYPQALDAIGPAWYETVADITIEQSQAQGQLLNQQLSAVRLGQRGLRVQGFEAPVIQQKSANDGKKDIISPTVDNNWGVWVLGNGIFAKATAPSDIPNYRFDSGGFLVGIDYAWSENFVTGVFAGYEGTYASYANGGRTTINSARFGGYATYGNGGFYANAVAGGGASSYNVKRPIQWATMDRSAFSKPDGGEFFTLLATGYDWRIGNFTLGPTISAQYTYAGIAPFTERNAGSLDLHTGQINANSLRTYIGGRVAYTWNLTDKVAIVPEARIFWQHEFLENPYDIGASLDGGSGPDFAYRTSAPDRDSVYASAGLGLQLGESWNLNFYYTSSFGRDDLVSHMISTGLNWKF